mgnify:CR=1 FL=1
MSVFCSSEKLLPSARRDHRRRSIHVKRIELSQYGECLVSAPTLLSFKKSREKLGRIAQFLGIFPYFVPGGIGKIGQVPAILFQFAAEMVELADGKCACRHLALSFGMRVP